MHHHLQTTHTAALSLEQQLAQAEALGRVYTLKNMIVRYTYSELEMRADRMVLNSLHFKMRLEKSIAARLAEALHAPLRALSTPG